jgi:hypothetical protein
MRARHPDIEGFIERGGVKVGYEVFGAGEPAILLLTSWAIVHAAMEGAGAAPGASLPGDHRRGPG